MRDFGALRTTPASLGITLKPSEGASHPRPRFSVRLTPHPAPSLLAHVKTSRRDVGFNIETPQLSFFLKGSDRDMWKSAI